jgi:tryptophanase
MAERLQKSGVPVLLPAGGHAIFLDGGAFYPQVPPEQFPGLSLVNDLYGEGGIRAVELGNVCFGRRDSEGRDIWPRYDFVRLAMPRRVYTEAHAEYVVDTLAELYQKRGRSTGFRFTSEAPTLRHFRSLFEPV